MGKPRCPNCNKYNTEEVVPRTYSKPGSLICFNCRQEYWTPPKNNNHKHSEARQEKVEKRIIHKKRKPWTDHMDEVLRDAMESGDYMWSREAGA